MKIHVEEKVCRLDGQGRTWTDAEAAHRKSVASAVDKLLGMEWEVRERSGSFWVLPVDYPDSAGSMVEVKKRPGRQDIGRKVANAVAMLPRIISALDEAGHCIEELLLELLPEGSRVPPRTAAFISLMADAAAAEIAEEGGAV